MRFPDSPQEAERLAAASRDPVTCPWCHAHWPARPGVDCGKCGGPLPMPAGPDRGPEPPPSPRVLPPAFRRQVMFTRNVQAILGLVFMIVGVPAIAAFGFGLLFVGFGYFFWKRGRTEGVRKLAALEHGRIAAGELRQVWLDRTEKINGRSPYALEYAYADASGAVRVGSTRTYDSAAGSRRPGEPVWVVYVEGPEEQSSLWPPLA